MTAGNTELSAHQAREDDLRRLSEKWATLTPDECEFVLARARELLRSYEESTESP